MKTGVFMARTGVLLLLCASLIAAGCSSYLHKAYRSGENATVETPAYTLQFIEADDEGWFWDPRQAQDALDLVQRKVRERNTIVLVFIHGWHHSARCCDDDLEGFKETLIRLDQRLSAPAHEPMQSAASAEQPSERVNVVGIYIGWRGRSLPGPLNYFSFWGRKAAAERVGNTDFGELLARLNNVYLQHNASRSDEVPPEQRAQTKHFLGLVTIGHSFGGQVLLKAVSATLEEQLIRNSPLPGYLRTQRAGSQRVATPVITGVGDLLVLINPAAEAAQYHRLHALSHALRYPPEQAPLMLTVSARNDQPRHRLFTFGRVLGEIFTGKPRKEDPVERTVERQALGVYPDHITHRLVAVDPSLRLRATLIEHPRERGCDGDEPCRCDFLEWSTEPQRTEPDSITASTARRLHDFDFSGELTFSNVKLVPRENAIAYQPFIVAEADPSVIDGHNGIFTAPFLDFLVPYIAFVETKYAQLRARL